MNRRYFLTASSVAVGSTPFARSPQVDVDKRCLIKSIEQVVLPLVGDGVTAPDKSR